MIQEINKKKKFIKKIFYIFTYVSFKIICRLMFETVFYLESESKIVQLFPINIF